MFSLVVEQAELEKELVSLFLHNHIKCNNFLKVENVIKLKKDFSNYGDQLTCFQADITSEKDQITYIRLL